jgi:type II secretory pathway pseudopilin PulG
MELVVVLIIVVVVVVVLVTVARHSRRHVGDELNALRLLVDENKQQRSDGSNNSKE